MQRVNRNILYARLEYFMTVCGWVNAASNVKALSDQARLERFYINTVHLPRNLLTASMIGITHSIVVVQ